MLTNSLRLSLILCLGLLLPGCQMMGEKQSEQAEVKDLSLTSPQRQSQHLKQAISLLENGEQTQAAKMIDEVLSFNPQNPTAKMLKRQLTQPASVVFNTERFIDYQVKSGDSLGEIANQWLGNPLYFVSLARHNKIDKPLSLQPGTRIQIPVTANSDLVRKENRRSAANIRLLTQYQKDKQFTKGLKKANSLFVVETDLEKLYQQQRLLLADYAIASVSFSEREVMLKQIASIAKGARNQAQKDIYSDFVKRQNRILFLDESMLLFEDESYVEAAEKMIAAGKLDSNLDRSASVSQVKTQLVNKLHEQAVVYYRNHELEKALDRWSLVLQLDPDNELAQKYTQRTHKLLNRLNQY